MAKCAICQKAAHFGNGVSHSHRRSNKIWNANVKSVKVKVNGGTRKMYVCTSCLRSGLVERALCLHDTENAAKRTSQNHPIKWFRDVLFFSTAAEQIIAKDQTCGGQKHH